MKRGVLLAILLVLLLPLQSFSSSYTGSISYPTGLYASDIANDPKDWAYASSRLAWTVDDSSHPGYWTYSYTFSVDVKNISHVILEVSPTFGLSDINTAYTTPGYLLDTYSADTQGNSNPGMPGPLYGLKWGGNDSTLLTWSIVTTRSPMWGDFYAVDGKNTDPAVYAISTGFGTDTGAPIADGNALADGKAWVLVPDTAVPIPAAAWLLGSGLVCLVSLKRRK
jgi:hypothetical protein